MLLTKIKYIYINKLLKIRWLTSVTLALQEGKKGYGDFTISFKLFNV